MGIITEERIAGPGAEGRERCLSTDEGRAGHRHLPGGRGRGTGKPGGTEVSADDAAPHFLL